MGPELTFGIAQEQDFCKEASCFPATPGSIKIDFIVNFILTDS